jgi:uncharacterized membrane protein (DUF485 family)
VGDWIWVWSVAVFFLFVFLAPFSKDFLNTPLMECFQKIDPQLGAIVVGAKVTQHGASPIGAKIVAPKHAWS